MISSLNFLRKESKSKLLIVFIEKGKKRINRQINVKSHFSCNEERKKKKKEKKTGSSLTISTGL